MSEVKDFLKALNENPKAKELIKAAKEPANADEAAALYADIAEKAGICVSKETIQEFLKNKESRQQEVTAKAEGLVKAALGEDDLESVAGGVQDERCSSTFDRGEWCWFSDSCSYVISYYDDVSKNQDDYVDPFQGDVDDGIDPVTMEKIRNSNEIFD